MATVDRFGRRPLGGDRIEPTPNWNPASYQAMLRASKKPAPVAVTECSNGHRRNYLTELGDSCRVCFYEYMAGQGSERHRVKLAVLQRRLAEVTQ